jgi:hypothetical protein
MNRPMFCMAANPCDDWAKQQMVMESALKTMWIFFCRSTERVYSRLYEAA